MAELVITNALGQTRTHKLGEEIVTLGRDPACSVPLDDLGASRRHARIRFDGGSYILEDLGSKNGTIVNDVITRGTTLRSGDEILIGAVRAVFRADVPTQFETSVVIKDDSAAEDATTYRGQVNEAALSRRRLEILYELTDRLTRLRDRNELLGDAMDVCFEMLRFERGAIALKHGKGNVVEWPVVRNLRGREGELKVSRTILSNALTHGERVIVNAADSAAVDPTISMVQNNIRSAMCVPLLSGATNLGVIYGDRVTVGTTYSKEDIDFLAGIARLVTTGLINTQLMDEQKHRVRLENEINMARHIQTCLFPARLPARAGVSMAALNHPGNHVSGDYYDFVEIGEGRLAFVIADVTGEGVAASLLMANLQAAVRLTMRSGRPLGSLLGQWNTLICENTDASKFITCLVGIVDPNRRTVELATAGHHPPYLVQRGGEGRELWVDPGFPLGVADDAEYRSEVLDLGSAACTLVAYTDGVIEAMNQSAEQYGLPRLVELIGSVREFAPEEMVERIRADVARHCGPLPQGDDITILSIQLP